MRRFIFLAVLLPTLIGCAQLLPYREKQAVPPDQLSFSEALDAYRTDHSLKKLQNLQRNYPDSAWSARAETLILCVRERERYKTLLAENKQAFDTRTRDMAVLQQNNEQLLRDIEELRMTNRKLTEKIEQLKGLLIQLEQRPQ